MDSIKTPNQVLAVLEFLVLENEKLNADQPKDSLHAAGHLLPGCNYCSAIVALRWVLGEPDPKTGRPTEFPYISEAERERLRDLADKRARSKLPAGSIVNNW